MSCCCEKETGNNFDFTELGINIEELEPIIVEYKDVEGSLITVLQKAQDLYSYLPMQLLNYIAYRMKIKPAKVLGVATFYAQFRLEPVGKHIILLCQGTACHVNGSSAIEDAIKAELGISHGMTTEDNLFTFNNVACLGCCSLSPVMTIDDDTYGTLTPESARQILRKIKEREEIV